MSAPSPSYSVHLARYRASMTCVSGARLAGRLSAMTSVCNSSSKTRYQQLHGDTLGSERLASSQIRFWQRPGHLSRRGRAGCMPAELQSGT